MLMISVNDVMRILSEYLICDEYYREVDKVEIVCRLNQVASKPEAEKEFTEEEWFE